MPGPAPAASPSETSSGAIRHPPGLYTLFFTEMWERLSYYGMRALLVLFMTDTVAKGGLGLTDENATAIYGLYTAFVYLVSLPGGWIADRLLGARQAVWYGGLLIALGHFTLAIPTVEAFYLGLVIVVAGTGLLKPNISVMVGQLYPQGGAARDAGFTIFYMGINLGAFIGPIVCSWLGEELSWHYGFGAAGVGMVLGLVQYKLMARHLGDAGLRHRDGKPEVSGGFDRAWLWVIGGVAAAAVFVTLAITQVIPLDPVPLAQNTTYLIVSIAALYFVAIFAFGNLTGDEKKRTAVLIVLLFAAAMFWAGFEQAGSSLNLFADRYTVRELGSFTFPAGWFQSLNPVFILSLSPVVAAIWLWLGRRGQNPSIPAKFALGLVLLGLGFVVISIGSQRVGDDTRVWPTWLIATYFIHTLGELCLSPVGLSAVTKLSPTRFVGQMMGLWFVSASLGSLIAGLFASEIVASAADMPAMYMRIAIIAIVTGGVLLAASPWIRKWIVGIQ